MTAESLPVSLTTDRDDTSVKAKVDRYLVMPLPVHYKEPIDQSKVLKLVFNAWAKGLGFKPIVVIVNREGEDRELKSTGEEIREIAGMLPEDTHIAAFAPSAAGPLTLTTMADKDKLYDFESEHTIDEIFSTARIDRAVIACSRVRIGTDGQPYVDGYRQSHKLYTQSIAQMDEYASQLDERVRLGILTERESDKILGYVAKGDVHVPKGTGIDTIPQVPSIVSRYKGHGKGIILGSMFDSQVRKHLKGGL